MTLLGAAGRLHQLAAEVRDIAGRVDDVDPVRWAIARDLRATAHTLDRYAAIAAGAVPREPAPVDPRQHWPVDHANGE